MGYIGSDGSDADGLCSEIINLTFHNGVWKPAGLSNDDTGIFFRRVKYVFLHKVQGQENILYITDGNELYWFKRQDDLKYYETESDLEDDGETVTDSFLNKPGAYTAARTRIIATLIQNSLNTFNDVDFFGQLFTFRNGVWYKFNIDRYEVSNDSKSLKCDIAFDLKVKGVCISRKHFPSTRSMQGVTEQVEYSDDWKKHVARKHAKDVLTELSAVDAKIKEEHIDGLCHIRYVVKRNGESIYLSDPVMISSMREGYFKKKGVGDIPRLKTISNVLPITLQGGVYRDDTNSFQTIYDAFGIDVNYPIFCRVFDKFDGKDYFLMSYGPADDTKESRYRFYGDIDNTLATKTSSTDPNTGADVIENFYGIFPGRAYLRGLIANLMRTRGYIYDATSDNDGAYCYEKLVIPKIPVKYSNWQEGEISTYDYDSKYVQDEKDRCLSMGELTWMITGAGYIDGYRSAYFYAAKEYYNLHLNFINATPAFWKEVEDGKITIEVYVTPPVSVVKTNADDDELINDMAGITNHDQEGGAGHEFWNSCQCAAMRLPKKKRELEEELDDNIDTYHKILTLDSRDILEYKQKQKQWKDINDQIDISSVGVDYADLPIRQTPNEDYKVGYVYNNKLYRAGGSYTYDGDSFFEETHLSSNENYDNDSEDSKNASLCILFEAEENFQPVRMIIPYFTLIDEMYMKYRNPVVIPFGKVNRIALMFVEQGITNNDIHENENYGDKDRVYLIKEWKKNEIKQGNGFCYVNYVPNLEDFLILQSENIYKLEGYVDAYKGVAYPFAEIKQRIENTIDIDIARYSNRASVAKQSNIINYNTQEGIVEGGIEFNEIRVGNYDIRAIIANTFAMSTSAYGNEPLYVFTDEGIFVLMYDSNGQLAKSELVSNETCLSAKAMCVTPMGLVFASNRGLMCISGKESVCLMPVGYDFVTLLNNKVSQKATSDDRLVYIKDSLTREYDSLLGYLENSEFSYINHDNSVLISNVTMNYCYKFLLSDKKLVKCDYKIANVIKTVPNNIFTYDRSDYKLDGENNSRRYLLEDKKERDSNAVNKVVIETRPIKLGAEDLKSSYKVVLKGNFKCPKYETNNRIGIYVFGSLDCEKWAYLGGNEVSCKYETIRNIGCKIERMGAKFLRVLFVGKLLGDSTIEYLEISSIRKYSNKIR